MQERTLHPDQIRFVLTVEGVDALKQLITFTLAVVGDNPGCAPCRHGGHKACASCGDGDDLVPCFCQGLLHDGRHGGFTALGLTGLHAALPGRMPSDVGQPPTPPTDVRALAAQLGYDADVLMRYANELTAHCKGCEVCQKARFPVCPVAQRILADSNAAAVKRS